MKYLIVANGDFLPIKVIIEMANDATILALDGAAMRLLQRGIKPHVILGDFDSLQNKELLGIRVHGNDKETTYQGKHGIMIAPRIDQSRTDLQKGIQYAKEQGATEIHIACGFGDSRLDHTLHNTRILRSEYQAQLKMMLHAKGQTLLFAKNETVLLMGNKGDHCGIFAAPDARFSSTGLEWDSKDCFSTLVYGYKESACNMMSGDRASIAIEGEALLTMPPQFIEQRIFNGLSESQQLATLHSESCYTLCAETLKQ